MPARPTRPNRTLPRSFARLRSLPKRKVARAVFVVFVNVDASSVKHSAEILFRKLAVGRKPRDAKVIPPIISAVGNPPLYQFGDEVRHLRNMFGRPHQLWLLNPDHRGIFEKGL